ncbi:MerR family transcriptional regulator [Anaerocolumna cellulosilytica]|uniref:MerR family transcriptional regulator n=2 Tax=Anaerocolumna cellulosilytica TaxID=433286 RepID=A0A6S6R350_9FIRM|nr:MerR family transcriptional regulator [Anaerocolumna cellulosilytica]
MKDYYKINEISKLYGIGTDSLRYYEKVGVLKPRRDKNDYRLYSLKDIYKLNVIRDLRQLGFSMQQIKEYLDCQSIDNTLQLLLKEQDVIHAQMKKLRITEQILRQRIRTLTKSAQTPDSCFTVKSFPDRPCLQLNTHITRDEEMDFAVKKLHRKHEHRIHDFGNQSIGAYVSAEDLKKGILGVFHSVFFILEEKTKEYDFILPTGDYLSYTYRGGYHQSPDRILELLAYAKETGRQILDEPFELYLIDNRDTVLTEEFLTEIQVRVSKDSPK